jgi:hypothetical protein
MFWGLNPALKRRAIAILSLRDAHSIAATGFEFELGIGENKLDARVFPV